MSQHIGPRTISAIGGSIKRVGNYRIHTFPSELVTDGLVLNLDAGDPRSYPSSGTTWTDLSGNGYNFIPGVFPTYSNVNGGTFNFDAVDDYLTSATSPILQTVTCEAWVKPDGTPGGDYHSIFQKEGGISGNMVYGLRIEPNGRAFSYISYGPNAGQISNTVFSTTTISNTTTQWYHIVSTYDSNYNLKVYVNGVLEGSGVGTAVPYQVASAGLIGLGDSRYFNGNISIVRVYNRALSAAEVAQNYDALKVRYTTYTNTFTPLCGGGSGKVEVLCVAGGGGGGREAGGGGGAGGVIYNSGFSINSNSGVSISVGAGGAGASGSLSQSPGTGFNGSNTTFSTLSAIGGGGGASMGSPSPSGANGGSGGGGNRNAFVAPESIGSSGGTGVSGQGFAGGAGGNYDGVTSRGGGGGGSGGIGQTAPSNSGGAGGLGVSYSISGMSQFYAGGGGGGSGSNYVGGIGGSGVGGNGTSGSTINGYNGIPNTGSGGGGGGAVSGSGAAFGGNGSNGIVIVRYPASDYNVELLIVGGGGGAGGSTADYWVAGGGGAGGVIYYSSYPVSAGTKYTITIGTGGAAGTASSTTNGSTTTQGSNGGNSIFGTLVSYGGGGGGAASGFTGGTGTKNNGLSGGSGGGGGSSYLSASRTSGGTGVSGQGNSGGQGDNIGSGYAGGGGGAGGAGIGPTVYSTSNFGAGLIFSITGSSVTYAQGGQGGKITPVTPEANSGTGGDSGYAAPAVLKNSTPGGSGIIIIAYKGPQRGIGGTVDTTSRPGYTLHRFTTTGTDFFIP